MWGAGTVFRLTRSLGLQGACLHSVLVPVLWGATDSHYPRRFCSHVSARNLVVLELPFGTYVETLGLLEEKCSAPGLKVQPDRLPAGLPGTWMCKSILVCTFASTSRHLKRTVNVLYCCPLSSCMAVVGNDHTHLSIKWTPRVCRMF